MLPHTWLQDGLPVIWPAVWLIAAIAIGVVLDRVVVLRVSRGKAARVNPWLGVALDALRPGIVFWFAIVGIHAAMVTSPLDRNVVHILDGVLLVLGFGSVTWVAARFAGGIIHAQAADLGARVLSASLLATIVETIIVVVGVLVIFQSLGIAVEPLLTALGVGGLAVALALQPTLANLFAGVQLVASKAVRPGDFISVSGFEGFVEDITWRTTTVRDVTNNVVFVPNQTIATSIFVSYRFGTRATAVELPFTIKAGADPDKVEQSAVEAATGALKALGASTVSTLPTVRFEQVNDGTIQARLIMYVPESVNAAQARNEAVKRLFLALSASS